MSSSKARGKAPIPTLRTLDDLDKPIDLEDVMNLSALYELGIDDSNDEHAARMGCWHPSSCGYCRRAQVLAYTRTKPTDKQSKRAKAVFEIGHMYHRLVQDRLEALGPVLEKRGLHYEFQREVGFDPKTDQLFLELHIAGTADGIMRIWNDSFEQRGLVEIKSQNEKFHTALLSMSTAFPNHLMQAHLYAWRFKLPLIYVFYLNKSSAKREVKTQLFQHEVFDTAVQYFSECNDYVRRGELPPREDNYLECSDCVYRTMCNPPALRRKNTLPAAPLHQIRRK